MIQNKEYFRPRIILISFSEKGIYSTRSCRKLQHAFPRSLLLDLRGQCSRAASTQGLKQGLVLTKTSLRCLKYRELWNIYFFIIFCVCVSMCVSVSVSVCTGMQEPCLWHTLRQRATIISFYLVGSRIELRFSCLSTITSTGWIIDQLFFGTRSCMTRLAFDLWQFLHLLLSVGFLGGCSKMTF